MAWNFRKSISLGKGVRLNIGKGGIGVSAGIKGLRVGANSKGTYSSVSIPGTGLSSRSYSKKNVNSSTPNPSTSDSLKGCGMTILFVVEIILLFAVPVLGFPIFILAAIAYYFWNKKPKQQAVKKLKLARKFFNQGNFDAAITILHEANQLDDQNKDVVRMLGGSLHNTAKYIEAIPFLKDYILANPSDFDTQIILANCFYNSEQYKSAIDILQKMPESYEVNLKAIQLLGGCFAAEKQYDLAINVFKKAPLQKRNLDQELMELHYNLALIYEKSGDKANALKHFKRVYAEDINYKEAAQKMEELQK